MDIVTLQLAKKYAKDTMAGAGSIKGDKGDPGPAGAAASINGTNTLTLNTEAPVTAVQAGNTLTLGLEGGTVSNPNLLDNWYFADPINQRGQTEYYTTGVYTIDRWPMGLLEGTSGKVSITASGVKITTESGSTTNVYFSQYIENATQFLGKTLTASILSNEGCFSVTGVVPTSLPASSAMIAQALFGSLKSELWINAHNMIQLQLNSTIAGEVILTAAKMELGGRQTLAHQDASGNWVLNDPPPNKALELAKCQRYQYVFGSTLAGERDSIIGYANTSKVAYFILPYPQTMRAIPTLTARASDWAWQVVRENDSVYWLNQHGGVISLPCAGTSNAHITVTFTDDAFTAGEVLKLITNNDKRHLGQLILDANL